MRLKLAVLCGCLFLSGTVGAVAEELCSAEQQAALDQCVSDAVTQCHEATPQCSLREVRIDQIVARVTQRCVEPAKNAGQCRRCITALIIDGRHGASRLLWPEFTVEVNQALRDLREAQCQPEHFEEADPRSDPKHLPRFRR